MTIEEARKIVLVLERVDSGCPVCVEYAVARMAREFPQFRWTIAGREIEPEGPELPIDPCGEEGVWVERRLGMILEASKAKKEAKP